MFGFLITDFADKSAEERMGRLLVGDVPADVIRSLRAREATGAFVWVMNVESVLDADHPFVAVMNESPRRPRAFFLVHESVHVNLQFARSFGGDTRYPYPVWAVQPEREALAAACYEHPTLAALHEEELDAHADAVEARFAGRVDEALAHARRYIGLRRERYERLGDVRVPGQNGAELSCEEAEAVWELDEGLADFVAARALLAAGIADSSWFVERIRRRNTGEGFYYTGSGQLVFLWLHDPGALERVLLPAIAGSESSEDGIFGQFERVVLPEEENVQ